MKQMKLSVGVSDFEKIRSDGYYYIDKSGWIKGLLKSGAEVTLLTRPRRFGKTLGMSMLANFFDIKKEPDTDSSNADTTLCLSLFPDLQIKPCYLLLYQKN